MKIMFVIIPIFAFLMFVFVFAMMLSLKLRGRVMSSQIKSMRHMTDMSKEDMQQILSTMGDVTAKSQNDVINNNEEILRDSANRYANINKNAVKTTFSGIGEGMYEESTIFCKHCGESIDEDSTFCKRCGRMQ